MTDNERPERAARQALDEGAPKKLRFGLAGWYEAHAGDFVEEVESPEGDERRVYEALRDEARRRGQILRHWQEPDWLEPAWDRREL